MIKIQIFCWYILLLLMLLQINCVQDNATQLAGSESEVELSGQVFVDNLNGSSPKAGVVVRLNGLGLTDTTDADGKYKIQALKSSVVLPVVANDTLLFIYENNVVATLGIQKWVQANLNVTFIQRSIDGRFTVAQSKDSAESVYLFLKHKNSSSDTLTQKMGFTKGSSFFSTFLFFNVDSIVDTFNVTVFVYDKFSKLIGRSTTIEFNDQYGNVSIPEFRQDNLIPHLSFSDSDNNKLYETGDTMKISISGPDTSIFNSEVESCEWQINSEKTKVTENPTVFSFVIPDQMNDSVSVSVAAQFRNGQTVRKDTFFIATQIVNITSDTDLIEDFSKNGYYTVENGINDLDTTAYIDDPDIKLSGKNSFKITTNNDRIRIGYPKENSRGKYNPNDSLSVWIYIDSIPSDGWQNNGPKFYLRDKNCYLEYTSLVPYLHITKQWFRISFPLSGNGLWQRNVSGTPSKDLFEKIEILFDVLSAGFSVYIDNLKIIHSENDPNRAIEATAAASYCFSNDKVEAVNDQIEPSNSMDLSIPRYTSWNYVPDSTGWIEYTFSQPVTITRMLVYWFQDNTGVFVPQNWLISYYDENRKKWVPVNNQLSYGTLLDTYNTVIFDPVLCSKSRIEFKTQPGAAVGILEWKIY